MIRVLYFGKFIYPWSTENYVKHALIENGCEVFAVDVPAMKGFRTTKDRIDRFEPDFVLFSKPEPVDTEATLNYCRAKSIPTICWQWDLFFGLRGKFPAQFRADLLLTTDGGHEQEFMDRGYNHQVLRQGIHKPEAVMLKPNPSLPQWDVGFVGGGNVSGWGRYHESRDRLLNFLRSTYGNRFVHLTSTRGLKLNKALSQIKVIVGDSYPTERGHYWSNRIYEITGRGGFLLHPETPGLDDEYTDQVHYVSYKRGDFDQLRSRIEYYLRHSSDRELVQIQGFQRTSQNLTYGHRVQSLLAAIQPSV